MPPLSSISSIFRPFAGDGDFDLFGEFGQVGLLEDGLLDLFLELFDVVPVDGDGFAGAEGSVPVSLPLLLGSLKYPATAFLIWGVELSSHRTMNRDIMAVTKSA